MKPGDLIQRLTAGNPWWRDPTDWPARDVQLRAAAASGYMYEPDVLSAVPHGSLVLLRGPRRVGKSVELKRFAQTILGSGAPPRAVIHAAVDGWRAADLRSLVEVGKRLTPPEVSHRWWLVDEICSVPGWPAEIKNLRDNDPEFATDTVVLTGSNARDLAGATSSLAGRRGTVACPDRTLLPMGFRTFVTLMLTAHDQRAPSTPRLAACDLRSPRAARVFHELVAWESELTAWWEIYLQVGGFPQAVSAQLGGQEPGPVVQALFDVIHRDAFGATAMSEPQVAALLARIASNIASPMNVSTVAADIAVSQDTGTRRLADLVTSYLLWTCPAGADRRPVLRSQAKRYFTDPLLARLAHLRNAAIDSPDMTRLTEQQLGMALLRSAEAATPGIYASFDQVLYERTKTRKEIDFVGPLLDPVAIEAKYTDTGRWEGEAVTVNASPYAGILATRGVLDTSALSPSAAWAIPASLLAFSIDV